MMKRVSLLLLMGCIILLSQAKRYTLINSTYSVEYDNVSHCPVSVSWVLRPSDFAIRRARVAKYFKQDGRLPKPRVKDIDFRNSGYMRGHMCPAGDRTATKAMQKETFLMSNIAPMTADLNCGRWSDLEVKTRRLAGLYDSVRVHVGALFLSTDSIYIARGRIRVPSHFFHEVRTAKGDSLLDWVIVSQ